MDYGRYTLRVHGSFAVIDRTGHDITPKFAKHCAVIAILALTPHNRVARAKIQSMLWGECNQSRASANLRQTIYLLNSQFNKLLDSDRNYVWLNMSVIQIEPMLSGHKAYCSSLLDGIDIDEEGFEDWLREVRSAGSEEAQKIFTPFITQIDDIHLPVFIFENMASKKELGQFKEVADLAANELARVTGFLQIRLYTPETKKYLSLKDEVLSKHVQLCINTFGNGAILSIAIRNHLGITTWATQIELQSAKCKNIANAIARLGQLFLSYLIESSDHMDSFAQERQRIQDGIAFLLKGVLLPHSLPMEKLRLTSNDLAETGTSALGHALLGTVHVLAYGESTGGWESDADAVVYHFTKALQLEPSNHLVLAFSGHSRSFFENNIQAGLALTKKACEIAPNCPISSILCAISFGYADQWNEALKYANRARKLSTSTIFMPLVESVCGQVALMVGNYEASTRFSENSFAMLPRFRPTVFNLASAHVLNGNTDRGRQVFFSYAQNNPDFNIDRMKLSDIPFVNQSYRERILKGVAGVGVLD